MAFPIDDRRLSIGAALSGSPPKHPTILPPAAVRASARVSLCTAAARPERQSALRIVAESADGALFCVDETSSAPSSRSSLDASPPKVDTSYAADLDMDEWARTPLPDRRKLHHSLWPDAPTPDPSPPPSRPPPGPPPTGPLPRPPRPLPRRPLPQQPASSRDTYKTHSRSFSDTIASAGARALPPPPLDLSGAKALKTHQQFYAPVAEPVEAERAERIAHAQTQERLERVERHYQHLRGTSLSSPPRHPYAVPALHAQHVQTTNNIQHAQNVQHSQHIQIAQYTQPNEQTQHAQPAQHAVAEVTRSNSRLRRVGRIPAQATPSSTPEPVCEPLVRPAAAAPEDPEEEEEIHFATRASVQRAHSVQRHQAVVVDLGGFSGSDASSTNRYAYHDSDNYARFSLSSFGPRVSVPSEVSGASGASAASGPAPSTTSQPSGASSPPSEYRVCAPLNHKRSDDAYVPPHRRAATPKHAPTQSQLLRAIEAQIHDSSPAGGDFTPAPSPISRPATRLRGQLPPLRPGAPTLSVAPMPGPSETARIKGRYPAPIAEAMLALVGKRNRNVEMQEVEMRKAGRVEEAAGGSVVELGGADLERREAERERKEKYTFKPPRGLLPSVVADGRPSPPPRSPLRLQALAPPRPPRSDLRPGARSPQTPGEMHEIALTPVAVDFSKPARYSVSSARVPKKVRSWYASAKHASRSEWSGARAVKLSSDVDLRAPGTASGQKIALEIPRGSSSALAPRSPGLTPRTPHTSRAPERAEAGLLPTLARRRRPKVPTDDRKKKKRLMIWLGVGVLVVITILASVLIAKNKQRSSRAPSEEEERAKQAAAEGEKEQQRLREEGSECARQWRTGGDRFACASCVAPLSALPNDFVDRSNGTEVEGVGAALQYCALVAVWDRAADDAELAGWGRGQDVCGWAGVACDELGRATSLTLAAPAMPATVPDLAHLVGLRQLRLKGDGDAPTGTLDVRLLANLTLLNAEYTALQDLRVANVSALMLVNNPHLPLPDLSNTTIATLAATYQNISSLDMTTLSRTLTYLDLSFNELAGTLPNIDIDIRHLYAQGNKLTGVGRLPKSLETVNLSENPLQNAGDLCNRKLSACELRQTSLNATACGTCLFS